jgi:uncharacterized delta-60 repeat protein
MWRDVPRIIGFPMNRFSGWMWLIVVFLFGWPIKSHAQPCSLDPNFNVEWDPGVIVYAVAMQTNGQMLLAGIFDSIGEETRLNLARLNHDGSLDLNFDPGHVADIGYVAALAVQPDGKVIIGGSFGSSFGLGPPYLIRLGADGTVDESFDLDLAIDGPVSSVALQNDGRILIAGSFTFVDNLLRKSVARLNADGGLDTTFDACVASSAGATSVALQTDGKVLMTGNFTFSSGLVRNGIARLKPNGDLDTAFAPGTGMNAGATAYTVAMRGNGKVLLGGDFASFHSTPRNGIAQLNADGTVDMTFDPGTGVNDGGAVYAMALQSGEKLLIGGTFTSFNQVAEKGVARLNPDGSLEAACDLAFGANSTVSSFAIQSDGSVLVGGLFTTFNDLSRNGIARLQNGPVPARLGPPSRSPSGRFQLLCYGEIQGNYVVQASSDLTKWTSITNFTASSTSTLVIDPESDLDPIRFYRAISLP